MKTTTIAVLLALCVAMPSLHAQDRQKRVRITVNDSVIVEQLGDIGDIDDTTDDGGRRVIRRSIRIPSVPGVPGVPGAPGAPGAPHLRMFPGFEMLAEPFRGFGEMGGEERVMGLELRTLNPQLGAYFGAPDGKGVLVEEVKEGSAAAKAGFKAGDVLVRAAKKTLVRSSDLRTVIAAHDKGEKIAVEVLRKGAKQTLTIEADDTVEKKVRRHVFRVPGADGELEDVDVDIDMEL